MRCSFALPYRIESPLFVSVDEVAPGWASNKPFDEWGEIFGDDLMAGALIDRLLHHCHIVNIRGNSYRMRHHQDLWRSLSSPTAEEDRSQPKRTRRRREAATI